MAAILKPTPQSCNNLFSVKCFACFPETLANHDKDQFVCQTFVCDQKTQMRTISTNTFGGQFIFPDVFPCLIVSPQYRAGGPATLARRAVSHLCWAALGRLIMLHSPE